MITEHGLAVWEAFDCATLGDYHNLYLRTDVLLLADVFENFLRMCLNQYKPYPAHYYTSLGLSWDALLKHTGVQLELLGDIDMHLFIEKCFARRDQHGEYTLCTSKQPNDERL